jgi:N-acetylmuramoyl-L-alanine amidase
VSSVPKPSLVFEANSRRLLASGTLIWMNGSAVKLGHTWHVSAADKARIVAPLLNPETVLSAEGLSVVAIDPGHGGQDSGAVGNRGRTEKELVLDIARRVKQELDKAGVRTRLTRENDTTLSLSERNDLVAGWNADLLVSIHLNFAKNTTAAGLETYVLTAPSFPSTGGSSVSDFAYPANRHDAASMALAFRIHSRLLKTTGCADRGIKHARFDIIRNARCPAILVECGFLSHSREEARLTEATHRGRIAESVAGGILEYLTLVRAAQKPAPPAPLLR